MPSINANIGSLPIQDAVFPATAAQPRTLFSSERTTCQNGQR